MGYNTLSQSGHTTYGIKEFVVDTIKDVKKLLTNILMGSAIPMIKNSSVWVLNSKKSQKELNK